ncbi:hypothetical protein BX661DRAFT_206409 [Kickxella alabastrina]|uniref:uncharacterized protein n=1 Tax=Kickxella alabastrina TaxID=61397 RepID=UPI00221F9E7A|nr:uncharacterized protein BX661DRAFT_206409 [Kickxella alabastrina]KAI7824915.1 hypothetical protein BX661DRAFT_206409 [Kickxella alabastrina]
MSINLEQLTTYQIQPGHSFGNHSAATGDSTDQSTTSNSSADEFHLISRQLPRTTTKLSRETLESNEGLRARFSGPTNRQSEPGDKRQVILEADSRDQKSTCTYEGDFEQVSRGELNGGTDDNDEEVDCVLIYDAKNKMFVIERVASNIVVRSEADETSEDELAKELEGMLDDASDIGDSTAPTIPTRHSRRGSQQQQQQSQKWESLEDELNMQLEENLDESLFEDVASDDDDFEEVDNLQFVGNSSNKGGDDGGSRDMDVESLPDDVHSDDAFDDLEFEEVGSMENMGSAANGEQQQLVKWSRGYYDVR